MAYTRRQELMCTEAQMRAKPNVVLRDKEVIYIKMNDGTLRQKMGDGVTTIINLPFTQVFDGSVVQTTGDSETAVMSQKAVTKEVGKLTEEIDEIDGGLDLVKYFKADNTRYTRHTGKRWALVSGSEIGLSETPTNNTYAYEINVESVRKIKFTGFLYPYSYTILQKTNGEYIRFDCISYEEIARDVEVVLPSDAEKLYLTTYTGYEHIDSLEFKTFDATKEKLDAIELVDDVVEIGGTRKVKSKGGIVAESQSEFISQRPAPILSNVDVRLSQFTGNEYTNLTAGTWVISEGGIITHPITVEANTTYLVKIKAVNCYTPNEFISMLPFSIGNASIVIFGANDGNFSVALTPTVSESTVLSIGGENWYGTMTEIIVNKLDYTLIPLMYQQGKTVVSQGTNYAVGNGLNKLVNGADNTAVGVYAQQEMNTGVGNVGIGYRAQQKVTNGCYNVGVGHGAQRSLTIGMYNFAIGYASQENVTSGCWNVAMGNESQRDMTTGCNNVALGRRAQNDLTTGHGNVAVGAQAGFARGGNTNTNNTMSTKTANYQTLVGFQATQYDGTQADELVAVGSKANGVEGAVAIGANASARGKNSIAIGNGAIATEEDEVVIGSRVIHFNADGTVTWTANA